MKVVVTGATSFIGIAVIKCLLEQGHEVVAVVRPHSANLGKLEDACGERQGNLKVFELPLAELDRLPRMLDNCILEKNCRLHGDEETCSADAWLHLGWDGVGSAGRSDVVVQEQNIGNTLRAINVAYELGVSRFLFTGSQAEYGIHRDTITEESDCQPVSEYGKAKLVVSERAGQLCQNLGMEYIHTRIFSVYGPGDHPWSLVNTCLDTWTAGEIMSLGECTQQWNFLYIDDAADAIALLLTKPEVPSGIYNVAGSDTRVLREFVEEMYRLCGSRGSFQYGLRAPNAEGPASLIPDISKLEQATGWKPQVDFSDGIKRMLKLRQD